jgi:AcrR family transcriptional regulator
VKRSISKAAAHRRKSPLKLSPQKKKWVQSYHHGALRTALLDAAEHLLVHEGISGLTLRAAARAAFVSHAAPKNHFGDLSGLLSELAALGFERLRAAMLGNTSDHQSQVERRIAIGRGYVDFAKANPALFLLMFRMERLDYRRPALAQAAIAAFEILASLHGELQPGHQENELTVSQAAQLAKSWGQVHGLALLIIDGQLRPILSRLPHGTGENELLDEIFSDAAAGTRQGW